MNMFGAQRPARVKIMTFPPWFSQGPPFPAPQKFTTARFPLVRSTAQPTGTKPLSENVLNAALAVRDSENRMIAGIGDKNITSDADAQAGWLIKSTKCSDELSTLIGEDIDGTRARNVDQVLTARFRQHHEWPRSACAAIAGLCGTAPGAPIGGCDPLHPASIAAATQLHSA